MRRAHARDLGRGALMVPRAAVATSHSRANLDGLFSGQWSAESSPRLLIVDNLYDPFLRYSDTGESMGQVGEPLKSGPVIPT